jgi:hypothetical protein
VVSPVRSGLRLAWNTLMLVPLEVVTGTRVPADVTTVKPPGLASATVPSTATPPGSLSVLSLECGHPTTTVVAATVPPELGPATAPVEGEGHCAGVPVRIVHL